MVEYRYILIDGSVCRFCIAPLDVLKIRLQLQIQSLADPLSRPRNWKARYSTAETFKNILREEGITVSNG